MRRAIPPKPTSLPSQPSRLILASGGEMNITLRPSVPLRITFFADSGSFCHGVSSEKPSLRERLYIIRPSQVSALYLNASRTKHPPSMLRVGSGMSSSGCVSLWVPIPPQVRHALSGLLNMK